MEEKLTKLRNETKTYCEIILNKVAAKYFQCLITLLGCTGAPDEKVVLKHPYSSARWVTVMLDDLVKGVH